MSLFQWVQKLADARGRPATKRGNGWHPGLRWVISPMDSHGLALISPTVMVGEVLPSRDRVRLVHASAIQRARATRNRSIRAGPDAVTHSSPELIIAGLLPAWPSRCPVRPVSTSVLPLLPGRFWANGASKQVRRRTESRGRSGVLLALDCPRFGRHVLAVVVVCFYQRACSLTTERRGHPLPSVS